MKTETSDLFAAFRLKLGMEVMQDLQDSDKIFDSLAGKEHYQDHYENPVNNKDFYIDALIWIVEYNLFRLSQDKKSSRYFWFSPIEGISQETRHSKGDSHTTILRTYRKKQWRKRTTHLSKEQIGRRDALSELFGQIEMDSEPTETSEGLFDDLASLASGIMRSEKIYKDTKRLKRLLTINLNETTKVR